MLGFVRNVKTFCSEHILSQWHCLQKLLFLVYSMDDIQTLCTNHGRHTDLVYKFDTSICVTHVKGVACRLWSMTCFQLLWLNRDGCHMWDKKCTLSHSFRNIWFHSSWEFMILPVHYIYTTACVNDNGLVAGIGLILLFWTYFIISTKKRTTRWDIRILTKSHRPGHFDDADPLIDDVRPIGCQPSIW